MKRWMIKILCLALLLSGCGFRTPETLTVRVFSIGKADSILLTDGTHAILIDAGEEDDGDDILESLSALGVEKLDAMILTHFDKDHIGGAPEVLGDMAVERVIMPAYEPDGKRYRALLEALDAAHIAAQRPTGDSSFTVGGMAIDIWTPRAAYEDSDNDQSLVTRVTFAGTRLLLLGDAEDARAQELLSGGYDLSCDILKIAHHGRYHETSAALLDAAAPRYALITDSQKNPAEDDLLALLEARGIQTLRTMDGEIGLSVSGGQITAWVEPD